MAQLSARYVCGNCKRRKKRCDKALPKCTQCKELKAECTYQLDPDPACEDEIQHINSRLMRLETLLLPQVLESASSDYNSMECPHSGQPQSRFPPSSLSGKTTINGVQHYLATLATSIFHSDIVTVTEQDICEAFFKYINKWLPIISQNKFYTNFVGGPRMNRRPETNLLLMCMYLLVKDPSNLDPSEDIHIHYKSVRMAYCMLQAESTDLLQLAQSGLILSTYEHASGLIEQAYATIWTCVRMMHSLHLEDKFRMSEDSDHDKQTEYAEAHALWWAILIRDRSIILEDKMRGRPLASQHPSLHDYVPVNVGAWESSSSTTPLLKQRLSDRCSGQLSPDSFEREAKACYLLGQVLDWRRRGENSSHVRVVAAPLEDFLGHLMDPLTGTRGTFCGATSMTITSIYELFSSYNPAEDILIARSHLHLSHDAQLVLSTMTRIVVDIANTFNENFSNCNLTAISPSYSYLMYRAGMHVLLTTITNTSNRKMIRDFYELRRCCWYLSRRWLVAVNYLEILEKSARALKINLPYLG